MVNISPIGRNASLAERLAFEKYDLEHGVRPAFIAKLKERFTDLDLTYVSFPSFLPFYLST